MLCRLMSSMTLDRPCHTHAEAGLITVVVARPAQWDHPLYSALPNVIESTP